jgi:hypothetical protein
MYFCGYIEGRDYPPCGQPASQFLHDRNFVLVRRCSEHAFTPYNAFVYGLCEIIESEFLILSVMQS